jgi:hypothetical protein
MHCLTRYQNTIPWLSSPFSSHCADSVVIAVLMGKKEIKSNIVHVHAMKACRLNGGVDPLILNLSTRMR